MSLMLGFRSEIRVVVEGAEFPVGARFTAHVRADGENSSNSPLLSLTTENGGIVRDSFDTLRLIFAGDQTESWTNTIVVLDVARTDTNPIQHLGFRLRCVFTKPITRGLA